jgi:hypothetical protein
LKGEIDDFIYFKQPSSSDGENKMSGKETYFTEEDLHNLELLPESEQNAFRRRFSQISMEQRIADDKWEMARDKAVDTANLLISDIKVRLAILKDKGE